MKHAGRSACRTPGVRILAVLAALVMPHLAAAEATSGCFVHAFAREQFRPPVTTYTGPRHEPVFMRDASSIIVGPGARLLGYSAHGYRNESLDVPPDAHVPDLGVLGFDRRVDSFKVVCGDGDAQRAGATKTR
jgi:hypothetical protein